MHSKFVNTLYIATKNPNILKNKTDFDDYSLRTNDVYDAIMQNGPDQVVFTKNWDLAIMLKSQMPAVFLYG